MDGKKGDAYLRIGCDTCRSSSTMTKMWWQNNEKGGKRRINEKKGKRENVTMWKDL